MKGKSNSLILSALKKIGKDQNLTASSLFTALIVGQKQCGFPLNSRGDLQGIGQADRVAYPNERRRFRQLLVNRRHGKRRERLEREFDFIGQSRSFYRQRVWSRISANVTVEVTACRA